MPECRACAPAGSGRLCRSAAPPRYGLSSCKDFRFQQTRLISALKGQHDQAMDQFGIGQTTGLPELGVHADGSEARQRVDLIDDDVTRVGNEEIDPRKPCATQHLVSLQRDFTHLITQIGRKLGGYRDARLITIQVFGVVGVELVVGNHFATDTDLRIEVTQYGALHFPADDALLDQQLVVKLETQCQRSHEASLVRHFADAHRRALIGRLDEHRQAQLRGCIGERQGFPTAEHHERRDSNACIAQQTLGHVFVHARRRGEDVSADKRNGQHAQHALQRTVLTKRAVDQRKYHVNGRQWLACLDLDKLATSAARQQRQLLAGCTQFDPRRIIGIEQVVGLVEAQPAAQLVDADQGQLIAFTINRIDHVACRLQRNLMLAGLPTENDGD
ncbi:hypothetical protein ALQ74_05476 [Pseudomonas savastanoi pv. glycinea]|uniref:Uncharacterized protein n=1 Tax=Pseudomonas savastanoi pv. glycinea TaxID=318 RepID=A0A3M3FK91_PSESG|nr:hypothetical protein ALQ74_05476 [Pseudomonas savastanoi pv. glycinea]